MKIKNTPKVLKNMIWKCVICSDNISVKVFPDKKYIGGNYFGKNSTSGEYWECDRCYKNWR